jgi:hypothetical protein
MLKTVSNPDDFFGPRIDACQERIRLHSSVGADHPLSHTFCVIPLSDFLWKIRSLRYKFTANGALGGSTSCMVSVRPGKC